MSYEFFLILFEWCYYVFVKVLGILLYIVILVSND